MFIGQNTNLNLKESRFDELAYNWWESSTLRGGDFCVYLHSFDKSHMESTSWTKHLNAATLFGVLIAIACIGLSLEIAPTFLTAIDLQYFRPYIAKPPVELTADELPAEYRKGCPKHRFLSTQLVSRDPKMILIEGFLTNAEAEYLVRIAYFPVLIHTEFIIVILYFKRQQ